MTKQSLPYTLRHNEAVRPGMVRIFNAMAQDVRELAVRPKSEMPDSIHDLRVLIKRLRAYLWFLRPQLGKTHYRHQASVLRKSANRLSKARDLHVIDSALTKAAAPTAGKKHLQALAHISEAFGEAKAAGKKSTDGISLVKEVADNVIRDITRTTRLAQNANGDWPLPGHRLDKAFQRVRKTAKKAIRDEEPPLVHEWRKKTKKLFYLLQLSTHLLRDDAVDIVKKVDKLQETLGNFQDSVVAENHLLRHPPEVDSADLKRTLQLLRKHRKVLLREADRHWRAIIKSV